MSELTATSPVAACRGVLDRLTALLASLEPDDARRPVPATPLWSVRDVLAHLAGSTADLAAGRYPGDDLDAWTAAQVAARADHPLEAVVAEWHGTWPTYEPVLATLAESRPLRAAQLVFDALTHEQDVRGALGAPGARDAEGWDLAWQFGVAVVGHKRDAAGVGALVFLPTDGEPRVAGTGAATTTVRAPSFEVLRGLTGRRSVSQLAAWSWDGPWSAEEVTVFPPRPTDLVE